MVKFRRKLQILNRVSIPQEIIEELDLHIEDGLIIQIKGKGILINKR